MKTALLEDFYLGRRAEFVETVEWFRVRAGISKTILARLVGRADVPFSTAKKWVAAGPPFGEIHRFSAALGVPIEYLVMRHKITGTLSPEDAELLLAWSYIDSDLRQTLLALIKALALRGDHPIP